MSEAPPAWFSSGDNPPPAHIVVGLYRNQLGGWHIGIAHRRKPDRPAIALHLAGHEQLRNEAVHAFQNGRVGSTVWVVPAMDERLASSWAAMCRRIATKLEAGNQVPYGFVYRGSTFTFDADLVLERGDVGLTCATFVLATFRGLNEGTLVALDSWRARRDDADFRASFLGSIRDPERRSLLEREPIAPRFRPTEVAGACVPPSRPVPFAIAREHADAIEKWSDAQAAPASGGSVPAG